MVEALLLIDLQFDFLPGGSLAVSEGDLVLPVAREWLLKRDRFHECIATKDWHPSNHLSFASQHPGKKPGDMTDLNGLPQVLWPDHCVQESRGAELAFELSEFDFVSLKGMNRGVDSYSGFFDNGRRVETPLRAHLESNGIQSLVIMGLATDYCVKFTVLDALSLGFAVKVVQAGCRGVNLRPDDSKLALQEMAAMGAQLI